LLDTIALFGTGLFGGFLAGLLGIGGSPIYVFAFTIFITQKFGDVLNSDEQVKMIIANTSFAKIFAALSGSIKHLRNNNFFWKPVLLISIPAIFIALATSYFLQGITYSKKTFSIIFIVLLIPLLLRLIIQKNEDTESFVDSGSVAFSYSLLGGFAGLIAAVSGLGGGVLLVPVLNSFFRLKIKQVVSISLGVILLTAIAVTIYYWLFYDFSTLIPGTIGGISLELSLPMIIGVVLAAPIGVSFSTKLSPTTIRILFVGICLIIIGKTIFVDLI